MMLERDERWHDVQKQRQQLWLWNALDQETGPRLDGAGGRRDQATLKKIVDRLASWNVTGYGTAQWGT
jgi:IS1 family transposase